MSHFLRFLWEWKTWITTKKTVLLLEYVAVLKNIKNTVDICVFIFCVEHYNLFAEID